MSSPTRLFALAQRTGTKFVYKLISDDCADTIAAAMER
jgi:hypothetical protein